MLIEQTLTMLQSLNLTGMTAALAEQRDLPDLANLTFEGTPRAPYSSASKGCAE